MTRDELKAEIRAYSEGLLSIEEVNAILEVTIEEDPELLQEFDAGNLMISARVWKSVANQAAAGSGPAQQLAIAKLNTIKTRRKLYE